MPTIVEYTDAQAPRNQYPDQIISPMQARACCHEPPSGPHRRRAGSRHRGTFRPAQRSSMVIGSSPAVVLCQASKRGPCI